MNLTIQIAGVTMEGDSHAIALDSPSHVNALNQRDTFSFRLVSKDGTYIPAIGAAVLVSDEDGDRFGGNIQQLDVQQFGGALISTIGCSSWEQLFDRRFTGQRSYVDQYAGVVFQSLLDECMSGDGITGSVVATGPRITISFDFQTVREAFDLIVAQASTLTDSYLWDCTPSKVARFYMQASFSAPFDIDDSSTEAGMQGASVVIARSQNLNKYTNRVYPRATQLIGDARPEEFTAAAGQDRFDLELSVAAAPTVTVDSVVQTVGIDGVDTGKDWYWSAGSNAITQDSGGTPLTAGQDVVITYQPQESRVLDAVQNDAEIDARAAAEGTLGYFSSIYEVNAPGTADEARAAAQSWLDRFSRPPCSIEYPTLNKGVRAGQHQSINLTLSGINDTFLIESVTMSQTNGLFQWRVRAVSGTLAGDYKMRLRELKQGAGTGSGTSMVGPQGPAGEPGVPGGAADPAPNVTSATCTISYQAFANTIQPIFSGAITLPTSDTGYSHLALITVLAVSPSGDISEITRFNAPFSGTVLDFSGSDAAILCTSSAQSGWSVRFVCSNEAGNPTAAPCAVSGLTIQALPVVTSASAVETGPRVADENRGLTTSVTVTFNIPANPLSSGVGLPCTIWTIYDWGQGRGVETTWKGWYPVTATSGTVVLTGLNNLWVTLLPSASVTIRVAAGAVGSNDPIPSGAATSTFTMSGPAALSAGDLPAVSFLGAQFQYTRVAGTYGWRWLGITGLNPSNPAVWYGRFYLAKGNYSGGVWTPDPNYPEWPVGDTEDQTVDLTTSPGHYITPASPPQPMPGPSDPYPYFRWRLLAFTRRNGDTGTQQSTWGGSAVAGETITAAAVYFKPDSSKAQLLAVDIDPNTLGVGITKNTSTGVLQSSAFGSNLIPNGDFSNGADGWDLVDTTGARPPYIDQPGRDGGHSLTMPGDASNGDRYATSTASHAFPCAPGDLLAFSCYLQAVSSPNAPTCCGIQWLNASHAPIAPSFDFYQAASYASGWTQTPQKLYRAPANAAFFQAFVLSHTPNYGQNNKLTTGFWCVDDITVVPALDSRAMNPATLGPGINQSPATGMMQVQTAIPGVNIVVDPGFEAQAVGVIPSVTANLFYNYSLNMQVVSNPANAHTSSRYLEVSAASLPASVIYNWTGIQPGQRVEASIWMKYVSGPIGVTTTQISFLNSTFNPCTGGVQQVTAYAESTNSGWQKITVSGIAPPDAALFAWAPFICSVVGMVWRLDDASIVIGSVGVGVGTDPFGNVTVGNRNPGTSIIPDWDFSNTPPGPVTLLNPGVGDWSGWGCTINTNGGYSGQKYCRIQGAGATLWSPTMPIVMGAPVYCSVMVRPSGVTPAAGRSNIITVSVELFPSTGSGSFATIGSSNATNPSSWIQISATISSYPANCTVGLVQIMLDSNDDPNCYWDVDVVMLQAVVNQTTGGITTALSPTVDPIYSNQTAMGAASTASASSLTEQSLLIRTVDNNRFVAVAAPPMAGLSPVVTVQDQSVVDGGGHRVRRSATLTAQQLSLSVDNGVSAGGFIVNGGPPGGQTTIALDQFAGFNGHILDSSGILRTVRSGLIIA